MHRLSGPRARSGRRWACALAAAAGITLLAAGVAASSSGVYRQYLAYSRCMRAHGAPFWPNPSTREGRGGVYTYPITAHILAQEHGPSWNAALSACSKQAPGQLPFTEAQLAAARTRLMKLTQCMRSHGYPSWPDPEINPNEIGFRPPRGANPGNPKYKAAAQACHLPSAQ